MSPPTDLPPDLPRFGRASRAAHWMTALIAFVCIATAAILYNGSLSIAVGHRQVVRTLHLYAGYALPVPVLLGLASAAYRADLRRMNRWTRDDRRWLFSRSRRDGRIPVGKFNAGQKLNAALSCAAILLLLGTGLLMHFTGLARLSWRTGATFVHDWVALAFGLLIIGHLLYAARDPESRRGMLRGRVSRRWAKQEHARWAAEFDVEPSPVRRSPIPAGGSVGDDGPQEPPRLGAYDRLP